MRLLLFAAAILRWYGRRPVQYRLQSDLACDRLDVERRYLVAQLGRGIANQLLYYPPEIGREALSAAEWLLTGAVQVPVELLPDGRDDVPTPAAATPVEEQARSGVYMRLWWGLIALGACAAGLGFLVQGRS